MGSVLIMKLDKSYAVTTNVDNIKHYLGVEVFEENHNAHIPKLIPVNKIDNKRFRVITFISEESADVGSGMFLGEQIKDYTIEEYKE